MAQAGGEGGVVVDGDGEDGVIGFEGDDGAGVVAVADYLELGGSLATGVFLHISLAVAVNFGAEIGGEGVDARDADAVQATGNLVGAFVELAAGVKDGEDYLEGALVLLLVHVNGDTAAVVDHGDGVVLIDSYVDVLSVSCKGLVDRVVDDLVYEVVETLG